MLRLEGPLTNVIVCSSHIAGIMPSVESGKVVAGGTLLLFYFFGLAQDLFCEASQQITWVTTVLSMSGLVKC